MSICISGVKFLRNFKFTFNNTYISECGNFFLKDFNTKYNAQKEFEILSRLKIDPSFIQPVEYTVLKSNHYIIYPYLKDSCELGSNSYYSLKIDPNKLFYKICKSIKVMHDNDIAHLDIKPANILIHNNLPKIIDFEFAEDMQNFKQLKKRKGTLTFASPEMIDYYKISKHCDMWSLGVVYYSMLNYDFPFQEKRVIKSNRVKHMIPPKNMNHLETELLYKMLEDDYKKRNNIDDVILFMKENLI